MGALPEVEELNRVLADAFHVEGAEVIEESGPAPNRRDSGWRCYLTVRLPPPGERT
jgi:hypothetical protein